MKVRKTTIGLVLVLALGAGTLLGFAAQNPQRELRATRFVVVDNTDREVMVLTANPAGEGVIQFLDAQGKPAMTVDAGEDSMLRALNDAARQSSNDANRRFVDDFMKEHTQDSKTDSKTDSARDSQSRRDSQRDSDSQSQRDSDSQSQRDSDSDSDSDSSRPKQSALHISSRVPVRR